MAVDVEKDDITTMMITKRTMAAVMTVLIMEMVIAIKVMKMIAVVVVEKDHRVEDVNVFHGKEIAGKKTDVITSVVNMADTTINVAQFVTL